MCLRTGNSCAGCWLEGVPQNNPNCGAGRNDFKLSCSPRTRDYDPNCPKHVQEHPDGSPLFLGTIVKGASEIYWKNEALCSSCWEMVMAQGSEQDRGRERQRYDTAKFNAEARLRMILGEVNADARRKQEENIIGHLKTHGTEGVPPSAVGAMLLKLIGEDHPQQSLYAGIAPRRFDQDAPIGGHWSAKEDEKLRQMLREGKTFDEIAESLPGRTWIAAQSHWYKTLASED